jgi:hypothetical protein
MCRLAREYRDERPIPPLLGLDTFLPEEVEQMLEAHELLRNGPYLRLTLPDVLPPDWDALETDLDLEFDEGVVEKATLVAPRCALPGPTVDAVLRVASFFGRRGVRIWIESPGGSGPRKEASASRSGEGPFGGDEDDGDEGGDVCRKRSTNERTDAWLGPPSVSAAAATDSP